MKTEGSFEPITLMAYTTIIERDGQFVSYIWKRCTLFLLAMAFLTSFSVGLCFDIINRQFAEYCIPDSNFIFNENSTNETFLNKHLTIWGSEHYCETYLWGFVFGGAVAIIWIALLLMSGHGGYVETTTLVQSWQLVVPLMLFGSIWFILALVYCVRLRSHFSSVCSQLVAAFNNGESCGTLLLRLSREFKQYPLPIDIYYEMMVALSWIVPFLWITIVLVNILRVLFMVDFEVIKIVVSYADTDEFFNKHSINESENSHEELEILDNNKLSVNKIKTKNT